MMKNGWKFVKSLRFSIFVIYRTYKVFTILRCYTRNLFKIPIIFELWPIKSLIRIQSQVSDLKFVEEIIYAEEAQNFAKLFSLH